jgi:hypothetical protein
MHGVAKWAAALACVVLLGATGAFAVWQHGRTLSRPAPGSDAALRVDARRLADISTVIGGSTLPTSRGTCTRYAAMDHRRTGYVYPPVGSPQFSFIIAVCADGGPHR